MDNIFNRPVSRLGFGCMRLPEGQDGEYIEPEIAAMFDYAMTYGINYFDSAWHYIDSQKMIGKYLTPKYTRESFILVGKLHFHEDTLHNWKLAMEGFEKELNDAGTDYMDLELMHAIGGEESLRVIEREDFWKFMRELKESGRAKHIGFSWHGKVNDLDRLLSEHPEIEIVQIQANYFDHFTESRFANGGGYDTYETVRRHGKQVIIMEPVKGGSLAQVDKHAEVKALFDATDSTQTPPSWALRYAATLDGVLTVLSGMSNLSQMQENVRILLDDFKPLTDGERDMLKKAASIIESKRPVGCTGCRYCMDKGCPAGIKIPNVLASLNTLHQYQDLRIARKQYYETVGEHRPAECLGCASCERECPQGLPIRQLIREADDKLWAGENYDIWANH